MTARLREAVPEYIRLDERQMALSATESRVKHNRQRLQHCTAELRGGLNEVAYLRDRLTRERQAIASAILVPKNRRSEHDELLEDLKQRLEVAKQHVASLRAEEQVINQELHALDIDLRALHHVRTLLESLNERVFDVDGSSGFQEEEDLRESVKSANNLIEKLGRKIRNVETAKQLLGRVEGILLEARNHHDLSGGNARKRSKSVDANFDVHKLESALDLYKEATRSHPSLPPPDSSRSTFTTLIAPPRPTPYHECLLLLRKVQDILPRLDRDSESLRRDLRNAEHHLKDVKTRLSKERVRILRAAVLSRDRERNRERWWMRSVRGWVGSGEDGEGDTRSVDEDLPPPYTPAPEYEGAGGAEGGAEDEEIPLVGAAGSANAIAIPVTPRREGRDGGVGIAFGFSPTFASPPYERTIGFTSIVSSPVSNVAMSRPSSSIYISPPASPPLPSSRNGTGMDLSMTITEEPEDGGDFLDGEEDVDTRPLYLLAVGSSQSLGRPVRTRGSGEARISFDLPEPGVLEGARREVDGEEDDEDHIPLRRALSLGRPVFGNVGSFNTTTATFGRTNNVTELRRSLSHSSAGSGRVGTAHRRGDSEPSAAAVAGDGIGVGAEDAVRTHRYRNRERGEGRERSGRSRRRGPVPLVSLIPGGIPVPSVPPRLGPRVE
ncbi:hypothetical protein HK097_002259 [Rhizophlyctis rosea]|uniref:Uncharacterized protein n=1 Tax=Rhizophlyctis rosea TaxID=64517 RepID=A0AAD5S5K1_9FUNG|nr:hypothetical protein HK097_002259 [Rhizophlyctis rosea]